MRVTGPCSLHHKSKESSNANDDSISYPLAQDEDPIFGGHVDQPASPRHGSNLGSILKQVSHSYLSHQ